MWWIDYSIDQDGENFKVVGDTKTEVMDKGLYKPGDIFVVDENGWLIKQDKFWEFMQHGRHKFSS